MTMMKGILQRHQSWGYSDEQVEAEVAKLTEEERDLYQQIKTFTDTFYRRHGYIVPFRGPGEDAYDRKIFLRYQLRLKK